MDKADKSGRLEPSIHTHPAKDRPQQQIHQKERKQIEQSRFFRVFEKDIVEPKTGERSVSGERSIEMVMPLPGIRFPIDKTELLDFAIYLDKEFEYDQIAVGGFYYGQFMDLPDKTYMNRANLEEALVVLSNTPGHGHHGVKLVGVKLLTTKEELDCIMIRVKDRQTRN
jgi:hypothetical protein